MKHDARMSLVKILALAATANAASVLSPKSAWFVDSSAGSFDQFDALASPITLALKDLRRDWYKVLGMPPTVLGSVPTGAWDGDAVVIFQVNNTLPNETFTVMAGQAGAVPTLTVTGADARGLIYGIYHVSADFLGVDAFWW